MVLKAFEHFTSNPLYAVGITELVYDARMSSSVSGFAGVTEMQYDQLFREQ